MIGFFHFHEITVFLARKVNRPEINEIIKEVSATTKRAFPNIPMHVKINIRFVDSDFKISNGKNSELGKEDSKKIPQGFNRRPLAANVQF